MVRILSVSSGKSLDVVGANTEDGVPIQQWAYAGGTNQQWRVHRTPSGLFSLESARSAKCLDVAAMSNDDGARLQQWSCSGAENQQFELRAHGDATFEVVGRGSGKCLDVAGASPDDGAAIQQWTCVGSANQSWRIELASTPAPGATSDGDPTMGGAAVEIVSVASDKVLDVSGASADNGATLQQWGRSGGTNQRWSVRSVGAGLYKITGAGSGKCVDVSGASPDDGTHLQQWDCSGNANQSFRFVPAEGRAYAITSAASGKCIDLPGGGMADGLFIQQWTCSGASNQRWLLRPAGSDATPPPPPSPPAASALRAAADAAGRYIGTAVSPSHFDDPSYATTAGHEFNVVTPENEMKWDATEPSPGAYTFGGGDAVVSFAQQYGMKVKGHTLVWHNQLPAWVSSLSGPDAVRAAMTNHITAVASHFRGKVFAWDVVNEAIDDGNGNAIRDDVFHHELGDGYIAEAFRIAHQIDPDALLFYNDYGTEGLGGKADAAYALAKRLVEQGVPISGVGMQMHVGAVGGPSATDIEANMHRIAALGLLVNVSEMDTGVCDVSGDRATKLRAESVRMHDIVAACMSESRCVGVTLWGVTDKYSWLNGFAPCNPGQGGMPWGLAFDETYGRKPAWQAIVDALGRR